MTHLIRTVAIVVVIGLCASIALAQGQNQPTPGQSRTGQDNMSARQQGAQGSNQADEQFQQQLRQIAQNPQNAADKLFVLEAAKGNLLETEIGRQAQQKAQNSQVKQLAQHLVQDHQQAQQQLQEAARSLNVDLPQQLDEEHRQIIQIKTSLPADQFEKHFTAMIQANHAKDLITYRAVAQMSQNAQVKQYAQRQLDTLSRHYDMAQQAAVALGLPSGGPEAIPASGRIQGQQGQGQGQDRGINPSGNIPGGSTDPRNNPNSSGLPTTPRP